MRPEYDVVIIGAGPIGGYLARKLNEWGHSVLLIEEHNEIGRPFQCAGLINPLAMNKVELGETVQTSIWGANIHSPNGTVVRVGVPHVDRTYSVCRKLFDEAVVRQSIASGSEIMLSTKPISATIGEEYCIVEVDGPVSYTHLRAHET